jgi:GNAT superfamily N-acetyltransferase
VGGNAGIVRLQTPAIGNGGKEVEANEITIRVASRADSDRIADLCNQLGYSVSTETIKRRLQSLLERVHTVALVAELNSFIAGWIQASIRHSIESGESAEITGLVVDETLRGKGIGGRLVKEAEEWAAAAGYQSVRVRTNVVRTGAGIFYRRLGFEETKQQVVFFKRLMAKV